MSYRTKTCDYCRGDHSVMDCTVLVEEAEEAKGVLEKFKTKDHTKKYIKYILLRTLYKRKTRNDSHTYVLSLVSSMANYANDYPKYWNSFNYEFSCYGLDIELIGSEEEQHEFCKEVITNAEPELSYEDFYELRHRNTTNPTIARRRIAKYEEAKSAKEKRAKKSCSYCRGAGHTVRTCKKNKEDLITHEKAYKISAYYTARALSRFGLWTGCMIKAGGAIKMWNPSQSLGNLSQLHIISGTNLLTEDQVDFVNLTNISNNHVRFSESHRHYEYGSHRRRLLFSTTAEAFGDFDFENNKIPMPLDDTGLTSYDSPSDDITAFYPVKISLEHIYKILVAKHRIPKKKTTKNDDEEFKCYVGVRIASKFERATSRSIYGNLTGYYRKKQRNDYSWGTLEEYVKENNHILNKISDLCV